MEPTQFAIRPDDPIVGGIRGAVAQRILDVLPSERAIRGIQAGEVPLEGGVECVRLDAEDAIHLVRPQHLVAGDVPFPTPDARELLELDQSPGVLAQRVDQLRDGVLAVGVFAGRIHAAPPQCSSADSRTNRGREFSAA